MSHECCIVYRLSRFRREFERPLGFRRANGRRGVLSNIEGHGVLRPGRTSRPILLKHLHQGSSRRNGGVIGGLRVVFGCLGRDGRWMSIEAILSLL